MDKALCSNALSAPAVLIAAEPAMHDYDGSVGLIRLDAGDHIIDCDARGSALLPGCGVGMPAHLLGLHIEIHLASPQAARWIDDPARIGRPGRELLLSERTPEGRVLYVVPLAPLAVSGREVFLAQMDRWMLASTDPDLLLRQICEALGQHLRVSRVGFGEIIEDGCAMRVGWDWVDGVVSMIGRHALIEDSVPIRAHRRGEAVITSDMRSFPDVSQELGASLEQLQIAASASIPQFRDGRWVALISAMYHQPRSWTDEEVQLIADVGERCWNALSHARALAQAEEAENLLNALVEHAPIGVYVLDEQGNTVLANRHMALMQPGGAIESEPALIEQHHHSDEGDRWTLSTRFALPTQVGSPRLTAGFEIDVTAQKQAEAALERSRETLFQTEKLSALGSLLAGVSHELNNPLSIVIAHAELLERKAGASQLATHARKVRAAAERCGKIVQTFLAMARQRAPRRTGVDLNTVAANALDLLDYSLRTSGVRVIRDLAGALPPVSADPDQLHQVLTNLLVNAQQAMEGQGGVRELRLRTEAVDGFASIEVADTGPGISAESRRRIFEPFFTDKPQGKGTGLGLSFSKGVVEAHGGTLEVIQTERGATFRVRMPIEDAVLDIAAVAVAEGKAPHARTALIVDDEADVADAIADFLRFEGVRCDTAANGVEAKLLLRQRSYDLIVSDLRMPELDGPALFAWITEHRPEMLDRVVFATGDTLGMSAARFLADAGRPYIEKPFTPDRLKQLVSEIGTAS